ncbi:HAD-IB family phosphatase [Bacillus sp. P14.5]|uniref:HAD-IB family phosphatase n=1 Tax=Bacillus sp. P14.5 TaxID=1983400 RepID=UPI0013B059DC|nr:HAD-IB family phosphatase [Bacillus sp. P14.5]
MTNNLIVFDVCGTLFKSNTSMDFLDFIFSDNNKYKKILALKKSFLGRVINKVSYKLLGLDLFRLLLTRLLKGQSLNDVSKQSKVFYEEFLTTKMITPIKNKLDNHLALGEDVILVSASYDFLIREIATQLNVRHFRASLMELNNELYTGKYERDNLKIKKN